MFLHLLHVFHTLVTLLKRIENVESVLLQIRLALEWGHRVCNLLVAGGSSAGNIFVRRQCEVEAFRQQPTAYDWILGERCRLG